MTAIVLVIRGPLQATPIAGWVFADALDQNLAISVARFASD